MLYRELSQRSQNLIVDIIVGIEREDVTADDLVEIEEYLNDERNIGEGRLNV